MKHSTLLSLGLVLALGVLAYVWLGGPLSHDLGPPAEGSPSGLARTADSAPDGLEAQVPVLGEVEGAEPGAGKRAQATVERELLLVTRTGRSLAGVPVFVSTGDRESPSVRTTTGSVRVRVAAHQATQVFAWIEQTPGSMIGSGTLELGPSVDASGAGQAGELAVDIDGLLMLFELPGGTQLSPEVSLRADLVASSRFSMRGAPARGVGHGRLLYLPRDDIPVPDEDQGLFLCIELRDGPARRLGRSRDLTSERRSSLIDLGRIDLVELGVLAEGRVVDTNGRPLVGAEVSGSAKRVATQPGPQSAWLTQHPAEDVAATRTDEAGDFELRGKPGVLELEVRAEHGQLQALERHVCAAGTRDLLLVLSACGSLGGQLAGLEASSGLRFMDLRLNLSPDGIEPRSARSYGSAGTQLSPVIRTDRHGVELTPGWLSGEFHWDELPAGSYTLRVRHKLAGEPGLVLAGLVVPPGGDCLDERLVGLDAAALASTIELDVTSSTGQAAQGVQVHLLDADGAREVGLEWGDAIRLALPELPAQLWVAAEGHCGRVVEVGPAEDGPIAVKLEPAPEVELRLTAELDLAPHCMLGVGLAPPGLPGLLGPRRYLGVEKPASLISPTSGRVTIHPRLNRVVPFSSATASRDLPPITVELPPGPLAVIDITLDQAAIDAVSEGWREP
ncbi:MAG: carboxypeptidase-like regulatory domain-containing protein [Planctomycetota bacterium]|nr:carboxypeptidase-like regulatory domain-containing protein [Planctomycetota bacterium]